MSPKLIKSLATLSLAVASVLGFAAPSQAVGQDGVINANEFVFYYNSYWAGSFSDFAGNKSNLAGYEFLSNGAGKGQAVKNNSASADNYRNQAARVYFNSGYGGVNDLVPALTGVQLTNTYNENASFKWI